MKTKGLKTFVDCFFSSEVVFPARDFRAAAGAAEGEPRNEMKGRDEATARSKVLAGFFALFCKNHDKTAGTRRPRGRGRQ